MDVDRFIKEEEQINEELKERFNPDRMKKGWRPHLFMPKKYWLLECTGWVLFGWFVLFWWKFLR